MYLADAHRYDAMQYRRSGNSGLKLSAIGLGFWHNFGSVDPFDNQRAIVHTAFDAGITYFDLANNYGPEPGSAETNFGRIMARDMRPYRDEMVITSKAGYLMWPGPYGEWGSRKNIIASANQSLKRLQLDYVDIFYSHRPDPNTPLEETALALDHLVHQGKALYIGISNYDPQQTQEIKAIFDDLHTPYIVHQSRYSLFDRHIADNGLLKTLAADQTGLVTFSPLAQGLLTDRYLNGIPADSRAHRSSSPFLHEDNVEHTITTVKALNEIAQQRGQSLAQMAIAWLLSQPVVTCVLVGASRPSQLQDNLKAFANTTFSADEIKQIQQLLDAMPQA